MKYVINPIVEITLTGHETALNPNFSKIED